MQRCLSIAFIALIGAAQVVSAQPASQPSPAPATAASGSKNFSVTETKLSVIMADPDGSAILLKHLPVFGNPAFLNSKVATSFTVKEMQEHAAGLTDEVVKQIQDDFNKLAQKK